jgi:ABC-type antimicrobial peptide transport system permease subunit
LGAIQSEVKTLDPGLPVFNTKPLQEQVSIALSQQRAAAALLAVAGLLALGLTAIGVYGVTSYAASRRTHEIGLRMALGAQASHVLKLVVGQGITPIAIGLALGFLAALGFLRFLEQYLFGISPWDPVAMVTTASLLLLVGTAACYVPARRASELDPARALRNDDAVEPRRRR